MNALAELETLLGFFQAPEPLIARAEHIPSSGTPEPYKSLLVHNHHMTVTMEAFHRSSCDVQVLTDRIVPALAEGNQSEEYRRQIVLTLRGSDRVVQFGIVRLRLEFINPVVRAEILRRETPLGRILIEHDVLRQIDLGGILRITPGPGLQKIFRCTESDITYGRLATIFCDHQPAIDLLEVSAPLGQIAL